MSQTAGNVLPALANASVASHAPQFADGEEEAGADDVEVDMVNAEALSELAQGLTQFEEERKSASLVERKLVSKDDVKGMTANQRKALKLIRTKAS